MKIARTLCALIAAAELSAGCTSEETTTIKYQLPEDCVKVVNIAIEYGGGRMFNCETSTGKSVVYIFVGRHEQWERYETK